MDEQLELPLSYGFRQVESLSARPPRLESCSECNPSMWVAFCELKGRPIDIVTPSVWTELDVFMWARMQIIGTEGKNGEI